MRKITLTASKNAKILKILSAEIKDASYGDISSALRKKDVLINGERVKENVSVFEGDQIIVFLPDARSQDVDVFYEDDNVLIVNKGKHIEVCDGERNLVAELKSKGVDVLPAHRLDRNTEGLVIFAKTEQALQCLISGFRQGGAKKYYVAEVYGSPREKRGAFIDYIVKNAQKSEVKVYDTPAFGGEKAVTEYEVLRSSGGVSLLSVAICDGKTHQIRASLAYHGLPIIGDGKYGKNQINKTYKAKTQRLKCYRVQFSFDKSNALCYLNDKSLKIPAEF